VRRGIAQAMKRPNGYARILVVISTISRASREF
jgi:hypothetical protein